MIQNLRGALEALAANADILPASGGAVQQLLQPDQEEKEDDSLQPDGLVDLFAESPAPRSMNHYIGCPPLGRIEHHRFRYFLDGAMRSYYLCSASERETSEPVVLGEIGSAAMHRLANGDLRPAEIRQQTLLVVNGQRLSDALILPVKKAAEESGILFIDTAKDSDVLFNRFSRQDSALRALGVIRWNMRLQEIDLLDNLSSGDDWTIVDGSVVVSGNRMPHLYDRKVIGVAKSFSKAPKFKVGRQSEQASVMRLLAELPVAHRTPVFTYASGFVGFWYVRLWEQGAVDFPLMGVVKCDMVLPSDQRVFDADMITEISRCLVAERNVTPYGKDARWHSHLYPIHIAEEVIRTRFQSPIMQREWLAREWARILRRN